MSTHLVVGFVLMCALVGVAHLAAPISETPCCQDQWHNEPRFGEVSFCPNRGS